MCSRFEDENDEDAALADAAKIADVGLARFMNSDHVTQMSVMGTLAWAAPEVMR